KVKSKGNRAASSVLVNDRDVLAAATFEEVARFEFGETRVARFDDEKEAVVGCATEPLPIEQGMMPARQAVHDLPREECSKGPKQHRELEHDWEKRRHGHEVCRFAV